MFGKEIEQDDDHGMQNDHKSVHLRPGFEDRRFILLVLVGIHLLLFLMEACFLFTHRVTQSHPVSE